MAKTTHKHRARKMLEELGWEVADVEKWIPQAKRRVDMFGLFDLLCVKGGSTLAVQVTSGEGGNVGSHVTKMLAEPRLGRCLEAGWLVELWGVRKAATRAGELVKVRSFELLDDQHIVVYEGSEILVPAERSV